MAKLICSKCMEVFLRHQQQCAGCGQACYDFTNDDAFLRAEAARVDEARTAAGLDDRVGGLSHIIINVEPDHLKSAVAELLAFTGLDFMAAFEDDDGVTCVLATEGSADVLLRCRKSATPFESGRPFSRARHLPTTRLETFVFEVGDLEAYVSIQKDRGVHFLTDGIVTADGYAFIQTIPSSFTGLSTGFVQWAGRARDHAPAGSVRLPWTFEKPDRAHLRHIKELDHAATRLEARDRDSAIIEFMNLTNYDFDFSVYVKSFNSITNVARLTDHGFAMVFTSGIHPFVDEASAGPTEKFVHNYGRRVHHLAFRAENIEATYEALKADGMEFLLELVGSEGEGLKQTFSTPSPHTLLVNEYIHRYGDFDGFFTKSNVTMLTAATDNQ